MIFTDNLKATDFLKASENDFFFNLAYVLQINVRYVV